jgi:hypothetical protein
MLWSSATDPQCLTINAGLRPACWQWTDPRGKSEVLALPSVDVGQGWLIFGLPPCEVAVHPADDDGTHELYLMVDDVEGFISAMATHGVAGSGARSCGGAL